MRLMILSLWLLAGTSGVSEKPEIRDLTGHLKSSVFVNANAAKRGPMLEVPRKGRISPCLVLARADLAARAGVAPFQTGCFDCFIKTQLDQICFNQDGKNCDVYVCVDGTVRYLGCITRERPDCGDVGCLDTDATCSNPECP